MQTVTIHVGTLSPDVARAVVSAFIGFILPWLTAIVIQNKWNKRTQTIVAAIVAFGAAFVQCALSGQLALANLAASFAVIWPVSQAIYAHVATNLGVWTVEEKTNFDRGASTTGVGDLDFPPPPERPSIMPKNDTPTPADTITISPELSAALINLGKMVTQSAISLDDKEGKTKDE